MIEQNFGTIAALEFKQRPHHGFEDIVEEVDISFQPVGLTRRSLIRESEDIAIVERDNLRVTLGWVPPADEDGSYFLVMAVGPNKDCGAIHITLETCSFVKDVLVEHLDSYLSFKTVFNAEATQTVGAELVETVADILRCDYRSRPPMGVERFEPLHDPEGSSWSEIDRPLQDHVREGAPLAQIQQECSLPKRLTIYTLGATMLLYTPPVGASLLVYSTLRDLLPQPALQH